MKSIRKKLFFGLLVAAAGVSLILGLGAVLFLGNHSVEYRDFQMSHAGELARVRAMMPPAVDAAGGGQTAERASVSATPVNPARVARVTMTEIQNESNQLSAQEWKSLNLRAAWEVGAVLPAGLAGVPGSVGAPLPVDEALRRRIREEVLYRGLGRVNLFEPGTSGTREQRLQGVRREDPLTTRAEALLDKTEAFLDAGAWELPDFKNRRVTNPNHWGMLGWGLAPSTILRRERAGDAGRAASLAERCLDYMCACRTLQFPFPVGFANVRQLALCEVPGAPGEATLARIDAALRRGRWSARQLADLRAAHVLRLRELWQLEDPHPMGRDTRFQWMMDTMIKRGYSALVVAMQRPTALAWAGGSAAEVYQSLPVGAPVIGRLWADGLNLFPPELAARQVEPPVNLELDLTRLAVAAARYRLAHGDYPRRLDDLIPRYLEPAWREAGGASTSTCWVVDWLEDGTYPDLRNGDRFRTVVNEYFARAGALPRAAESLRPLAAGDAELKRFGQFFGRVAACPLFYQVRRVTLPRECAPAAGDNDNFLGWCIYDNYASVPYPSDAPSERAILRRLREGTGDMEVLVVRGFVLLR